MDSTKPIPDSPSHHQDIELATRDDVAELVERFQRNHDDYRQPGYNETRVRREFIDPFFEALGWDVNNKQGYAEAYKDVIHEDAIRISGRHKAPDYCFRVGGARKFFVEAKKPAVDLARDPMPAYQVRRYAWSAKLPLSILTDFEELAVYDCRVQPEAGDKATTARTLLINFQDYLDRWDEIAAVFSRESVLKGSFDQYATSTSRKRGTAEVDSVFLKDLQGWRELLARNIALRNPGISARELNYAVQQILDRIVFLRIAEDREIEPYGRLAGVLKHKNGYEELKRLFQLAEDRYNSGLFHFTLEKGRTSAIDAITLGLTIDDKALRQIIGSLYYPDSPYEFSVISSDILGQVYEQFLGQVIRLDNRGRAQVEDKPEVRKAGGVFYTPTFIVDYIVERTIGRLLEGKTPKQAALLRFLDPACGSGSFLIAIFQFLLDWHLDYYLNDGPERHARGRPPRVYQATGGAWRLTADEKKRILLNNVFGVDLDPQAVEVTKLSLLLKVLEGETEETLGAQLALFQERVLPDLSNNIKCGNSLIAPQDFYTGQQLGLLDEEELYRVNAFDWKAEFPQVFSGPDPGFDAVLGNPPYIRIQTMKEWAPLEVEFYKRRYVSASKGNYDIYVVFVERGLELLNSNGLLGYILPHKFFNAKYGEGLRGLVTKGKHLSEIVHFGHQQVFDQASTYTALLFLEKRERDTFTYETVNDIDAWRVMRERAPQYVSANEINAGEWNIVVGGDSELFEHLRNMPVRLGDLTARIAQGIRTSDNDVYVVDVIERNESTAIVRSKASDRDLQIEVKLLYRFLRGREIKAYSIADSGKAVVVPYKLEGGRATLIDEADLKAEYPLAYSYLSLHRDRLERREQGRMRGPGWYGYIYPKNLDIMQSSKILVPDIADRSAFAWDELGEYACTSGYGITLREDVYESPLYFLALLHSRLLDFYLRRISTPIRGGFFRYFSQYLEQLPVRRIDFTDSEERQVYGRVVALAKELNELVSRQSRVRASSDAPVLSRRATAMREEIDRLVLELYGVEAESLSLANDERQGASGIFEKEGGEL